jgi:alpha-D-ribose 1-methylphosphonate 5-triphosphate diphosphatase
MFARRIENNERYAARNYQGLLALAQKHKTPLASHDDTTPEHVEQALADRVAVAEFPTTVEAAEALHAGGVKVLMGAPNLVRGGSHSGNVATASLSDAGFLDILSSDYVPSSLLLAALRLPEASQRYDLPAAIRTVTKTPAEVIGLADRGEIAVGKRADLIRIHQAGAGAAVRSVWNAGHRVA